MKFNAGAVKLFPQDEQVGEVTAQTVRGINDYYIDFFAVDHPSQCFQPRTLQLRSAVVISDLEYDLHPIALCILPHRLELCWETVALFCLLIG